ncbi:DUF1214 domain-containing protein [Paraburkholderia sacchari]|uniref:DUF1214 domain-containing protein n=1 Tax=Paraburkholderia sacchari TaxID=159450 RepID=UPI000541B538|nr:DUF1214 domain-containing protein [Paraburkholderia sacchari]NLP64842.1 DUF1214 domain-containing protein [Paraburkholderia sacchari]
MSTVHQDSPELDRVWEQFCDTLKRAGNQILRSEAPDNLFDRAEGYRYLSRLTRIALEMQVESGDADFPTFMVPSHETAKIGADNPDNFYQVALISGRNEYRVTGSLNDAKNINFSTKRGGYDTNGRLVASGLIEARNMTIESDGSFELILSKEERHGNWLKLDEDTSQLLIRQYLPRRRQQQPAQIRIERIGATEARPKPLNPAIFAEKLLRAGTFVENTSRMFCDWAESYLSRPNTLPAADQKLCQAVGGDPNIFYYHAYWELKDGEALVVKVPRIPKCDYWNFVIQNYWLESLDFRYFDICINKETAVYDENGGVTLVLANENPGAANWLETAGHRRGTMCFRWIGANEHVQPETEVVALQTLKLGN